MKRFFRMDLEAFRKWAVFASIFVTMFFLTGGVKACGVLFEEMTHTFDDMTAALSGLVFITPFAVGSMISPLISAVLVYVPYRRVASFGGFLFGLGYICAGLFASNALHFLIFAIISGIGNGCLLLPSVLCLRDHFPTKFPTLMPIAMLGSFAGIAILPLVMQFFLDYFGLRSSFLLFGALALNTIPCGLLLVHAEGTKPQKKLDYHDLDAVAKLESTFLCNKCCYENLRKLYLGLIEHITLCQSSLFVVFFMIGNLRKIPTEGWTLFLLPHTKELSIIADQAVVVATLGGVGGVTGRILAASTFLVTKIPPLFWYSLSFVLGGIVFLLFELRDDFIYQACCSFLSGLALGAQSGMQPGILQRLVSFDEYRPAYGLIDFGNGIISLLAGIGSGYLFDISGTFRTAFRVFSVVSFLNVLLVIILYVMETKKLKS